MMPSTQNRRVLLAVLIALQVTTLHADATDKSDAVALRFNWPSPLVLQVDRSFKRVERRRDGAEIPPVISVTRYVWRGEQAGDNYNIGFSDFNVVLAERRPSSVDALVQLEYVSRAVEPLLPTLVVDEGGQPVNLLGLPALRKRILAEYQAIPGLGEDAQARRAVDVLSSEQVLNLRAFEDWNRMVQVWADVDAEIGEIIQGEADTGAATGSTVNNTFTYSIESRVPCQEAAPAKLCVRLVMKQVPSSKNVQGGISEMLGADVMTALGAPPTAHVDAAVTSTIETHPETLVPTSYVKEKRWDISWRDNAGRERVFGRTDRWTYRFTTIK
jgi:hypothetical protein